VARSVASWVRALSETVAIVTDFCRTVSDLASRQGRRSSARG